MEAQHWGETAQGKLEYGRGLSGNTCGRHSEGLTAVNEQLSPFFLQKDKALLVGLSADPAVKDRLTWSKAGFPTVY